MNIIGFSGTDLAHLNHSQGGPYIIIDGTKLWPSGACMAPRSSYLQEPSFDLQRRLKAQLYYHEQLLEILQHELDLFNRAMEPKSPIDMPYQWPDSPNRGNMRWMLAIMGNDPGKLHHIRPRLNSLIAREQAAVEELSKQIVPFSPPMCTGLPLIQSGFPQQRVRGFVKEHLQQESLQSMSGV